jgi:hypothetical protein
MTRSFPRAALALCCAALAACADSPSAVPPATPEAPTLAMLSCTARVAERVVRCAGPVEGAPQGADIAVGGQGTYVFLASGPVTITDVADAAARDTFAFDVTVQNLLAQPMGTEDGTTPAASGVRVFFHSGPSATGGAGQVVAVTPAVGAFTGTHQPFYQYDGILATNQTSAPRRWKLAYDPTVTSFTFGVYVSAAVPFPQGYVSVTPPADSLAPGATVQAGATVRTAVGNPVAGETVAWSTSNPAVATVSATGLVSAVAPGTATITATAGARTGSAQVAVCHALPVGGAATPAEARFCVGEGEYALVATSEDAAAIALTVTGSGITPAAGPPSPDAAPWRAAAPLAIRAPAAGPRAAITPGVPAVGALMSINVRTSPACSSPDLRTGRVIVVGTHAIVLADTTNPSGGLTVADYQAVADAFDDLVYPVVTSNFGAPSNRDGNGRVVIFYTRAVNELSPPGTAPVAGFFAARDLVSASTCPTSNVGELIYMMAADPAGNVNGNPRSVSLVRSLAAPTLAHELQHLVNASRRLDLNGSGTLEAAWLDDALSDAAVELVFHAASGMAPRSNLSTAAVFGTPASTDAFERYMRGHLARLRAWMRQPGTTGAFAAAPDSASRGAAWAFLRYAADRRGGTEAGLWDALVPDPGGPTPAGLANLDAALGASTLAWYRDWLVSVYADDAVPGVAAAFTQPSWNFRALYPDLGFTNPAGFPLSTVTLANGVASPLALSPGGAAGFRRFGVPAGGKAGLALASGAAAPPVTARVLLLRTR